jgi:hypothetical protein
VQIITARVLRVGDVKLTTSMRRRDHTSDDLRGRGHGRPPAPRTGSELHLTRHPTAHERHAGAVPGPSPAAAAGSAPPAGPRHPLGLLFVRYGIGWLLVLVGIVLAAVNPGGFGWDGFGIFAGCGLSILLLNFLYRIGVSGDEERGREEAARRYLAEHGRWPDDPVG